VCSPFFSTLWPVPFLPCMNLLLRYTYTHVRINSTPFFLFYLNSFLSIKPRGWSASDAAPQSDALCSFVMELFHRYHKSLTICSLCLFSLQTSIKEGLLLKQTSSFQRWKKRYFKLRGRTLYYAKDAKVSFLILEIRAY